MNGWTPTINVEDRIKNLLEQVPQEYQSRAAFECYNSDPYEFERVLVTYVICKVWETYPSPIDEAEGVKWDFTPAPKDMPIIDFDNIPEIPF
jgi:hypothetical protein